MSTWAKQRSWYLDQNSIIFGSPAKTPAPCVSRLWKQTLFSVEVATVGHTRNAVVSPAHWSSIPTSCVRMYWTGKTSRWQTNGRGHSGKGEAWGGIIGDYLSSDGGCELASVKYGATSICSCTSSHPAHLSSSAEEEFIIRTSGSPCSMQTTSVPQPHLICIICNAMTGQWSAGCVVSVPKAKSAKSPGEDTAWRSSKFTLHPSTQMAGPGGM